MIKTLNKWEGFGSENDDHSLSLSTLFFKRLITYPETEFLKECYLYLYRQFAVEQNMPSKILKINKLLEESGISCDFIETPSVPIKTAPKSPVSSDTSPKERAPKFKRTFRKLDIRQLILLAENDFDLVNKYILDHHAANIYNRLRPVCIELYSESIDLLKDWFNGLSVGLKSKVEKADFRCKRLFLEMINKIAAQRSLKKQTIIESANSLIEEIQKQLPGTLLTEYIEENIKLNILLKPIYQSSINTKFNAEYILSETDLIELISKSQLQHVTKWEDLILKYFDKPILVRANLQLSKKAFTYDHDLARSFLEKAFKIAAGISFRSEDWEVELLDWAYICFPEKANYFLLHNFYAEFVDRESELLYNLSKKVIPWQEHFNDPTFFETYYLSNYQYNIKLAEGLPEPGLDTSFIVNHEGALDFETITVEYLVGLFDYPVVKIRHLALESLCSLYKYNKGSIVAYALNKLAGKSSNQIEHFLLLLYALSISHKVEIGDLINKMGWIFDTGHYNIQESYVDLINYHSSKGTIIEKKLQDTAASIHKKPVFPNHAIIRPLLSRRYFTVSSYQNELIEEINQSENDDNNFSDELYTLLTESGYDIIASRKEEAKVHRHFNINTNFDNLEINGPGFQMIQDKINCLFFKHIQQGLFNNKNIRELKYEFRIYDPTDPFFLRVSRPDYVFWKGKEITEVQFIAFSDIDELLDGFTSRQNDNITVFENGYQRIDKYPNHFTQYFQVEAFLVGGNITISKIQAELNNFNAYVSHDNLYRSEMEDFFSKIDNKYRIGNIIYPLVAVSKRYFRHNPEGALAIPLSHFNNSFGLTQVSDSLNYINKNLLKVVEFIEWQDQFKDHDRRRFEPLSQGCTLNFNKSLLKEYITEKKLDLYINLSLRRSVDKYIPESEMNWVEQSYIRKIDL